MDNTLTSLPQNAPPHIGAQFLASDKAVSCPLNVGASFSGNATFAGFPLAYKHGVIQADLSSQFGGGATLGEIFAELHGFNDSTVLVEGNSNERLSNQSAALSNAPMQTVEEIRHSWLLRLIEQHGSLAALNAELGRARNDATLQQIKNKAPNTRTGAVRSMGSDLAREIEEKLGMERGALDNPPPPITSEALELAKAYDRLPQRLRAQIQEQLTTAEMAARMMHAEPDRGRDPIQSESAR